MILPNKSIRPVDSLFCISSFIVELLSKNNLCVDSIHYELQKSYPKSVSVETVISCINFLYILGKVEMENETIKAKL
ncbi:ABC-three component system middle component 6 [Pseudoalteromonas sp. SG43-6]|uniref:ABC-three component system middle component 6 n=1 Tax=Pseudoalteromonas sp. SG43-6 TaxID=2760967 RepID=UPI0038574408